MASVPNFSRKLEKQDLLIDEDKNTGYHMDGSESDRISLRPRTGTSNGNWVKITRGKKGLKKSGFSDDNNSPV